MGARIKYEKRGQNAKNPGLRSPEGFLKSSSTTVTSMDACLHAHSIVVCRRKATYCAQKWFIIRFYKARLLRSAVLNISLVAFNCVVFHGLFECYPNAALCDVNEAEVRRG